MGGLTAGAGLADEDVSPVIRDVVAVPAHGLTSASTRLITGSCRFDPLGELASAGAMGSKAISEREHPTGR
jgi:hypothetical protein